MENEQEEHKEVDEGNDEEGLEKYHDIEDNTDSSPPVTCLS